MDPKRRVFRAAATAVAALGLVFGTAACQDTERAPGVPNTVEQEPDKDQENDNNGY